MGCSASRACDQIFRGDAGVARANGAPASAPASGQATARRVEAQGSWYQGQGQQLTYQERAGQAERREAPEVEQQPGSLGDLRLGLTDDSTISSRLSNLPQGEMYVDEDFSPDHQSLYYSQRPVDKEIVWKRPKDISTAPYLLVDDVCRNDIKQGWLGDCWFLSSCAVIAQEPKLMRKVIPSNPALYGNSHQGLVKFRFYRFGEWTDVYVDDLLPTKNNQLIYAKSQDSNEFWVALIEKAYAKLHGTYEAIEGGQTMDALVDLTGGLAERYDIRNGTDSNLYSNLHRAANTGSFIATSKKGNWKESHVAEESTGLVSGHAYSITAVKKINTNRGQVELVRIRNPWGNDIEWKGDWSDDSSKWNTVTSETKNKIDLKKKGDGEFWMAYTDFVKHFQEVTICTIGPDFDADGDADRPGCVRLIHGKWEVGKNAGGSRNNLETFANNPQFLISLQHTDDFDDSEEDPSLQGKCSVVITLMQEHRRSKRHLGVKTLQIAFCLYQCPDTSRRLPKDHYYYNYDQGTSGSYINYREVSGRFNLLPGDYVIIPSTFEANQPGTFLIRTFAQKDFQLKELGTDKQSREMKIPSN